MLFWNRGEDERKKNHQAFHCLNLYVAYCIRDIFFHSFLLDEKQQQHQYWDIYIFRLNSLNRFHSKTIHPHPRDSLLFLINIIFFDEHFLDDDLCSCNFCWLAGLINLYDIFISYTWRLVILFCASTIMLQRMN